MDELNPSQLRENLSDLDINYFRDYYFDLKKTGLTVAVNKTLSETIKSVGIILGNIFLEFVTCESIPFLFVVDLLALGMFSLNGVNIILDSYFYETKHFSLYADIMQEYYRCNKRIADALVKNGENNPARIAGGYYFLLCNGFFSYEHEFCIKNTSLDDLLRLNLAMLGLDVICGNGVCRNVASHFSGILNELDINERNVYLDIDDSKNVIKYFQQIGKKVGCRVEPHMGSEANVNKSMLNYQEIFRKLFGNHVINAVEFDNKAYYLDIINRMCYQKRDKFHLELYDANDLKKRGVAKNEYVLSIRTLGPVIAGDRLLMERDKKLSAILKKETASFEEISTEFLKGQLYALENCSWFEKLYEANLDSYRKIYNNLSCCEEIVGINHKKILKKVRQD